MGFRRPQAATSTIVRGLMCRAADAGIAMRMPGRCWCGPLPALTDSQRETAARLRADVEWLAGEIGERHIFRPSQLHGAEEGLEARLGALGVGPVERQSYRVGSVACTNLWVDVPGRGAATDEVVVVGAHYDSVLDCPAANDNATGVAAVLEIGRRLAVRGWTEEGGPRRTVRLALFVNEEPPHFWTEDMGSLRLARLFRERGDQIVGMLTPETIGWYSDEPGSQAVPLPLRGVRPRTGDYIAFIGLGRTSTRWVRTCVGAFRDAACFPCAGASMPCVVPGVGSSDHWSFWRCGWPALMITDTAPCRYPFYHTPEDTPDKVDYEKAARVVEGVGEVVAKVAKGTGLTR